MTIKPIDLQTNIAQMHEIAKNEHGRAAAYIEGQHSMEKNAGEEALRVRNKLEENKQAEKTAIMREEEHRRKKGKRLHHKAETDNKEEEFPEYKNIGHNIDVKR